MPETTGQRIKAARREAGLSVRDLAEIALGGRKNASLITHWETDKVMPSVPSLRKIAPHINRSVSELIGESHIEGVA